MPNNLQPKEAKGAKAVLLAPGTLAKIDKRIREGDPRPSREQFDISETPEGVDFQLKRGRLSSLAGLRFAVTPKFTSEGDYAGTCEIGEGTINRTLYLGRK